MTVLVRKTDGKTAKHTEGQEVYVREGHLFVTDGQGQEPATKAVYAPGLWRYAEVGDEPAQIQ